jgi:hypothetical protein
MLRMFATLPRGYKPGATKAVTSFHAPKKKAKSVPQPAAPEKRPRQPPIGSGQAAAATKAGALALLPGRAEARR